MHHSDFVHLHNHSDYSLLDGASPIIGMVERAAALAMPALALTDHGSLFGAVEFYQEARRAGVKPIIGMEAYVTRGRRQDKSRETAHHLVLLARDERGFRNLMRLSSLAFLEGFYYKPRVDHALLAAHAEGLLGLSACPKGEIGSDLLEDNEERAYQTASRYREIFGPENFFLEIQNHGLEIEEKIRERLTALAERTGIPLVATNDCHYLRHDDADAHDVLLCIQTGRSVDDAKRLRYATDQLYFRSADEMRACFPGHPEALRNTLAVAERCNLQMDFGKPLLPAFPLPAGAGNAEDYLRRLTLEGLPGRYPEPSEEVRRRMEYELEVICRMGFASYFLIVRDFIDFARQNGIGVGPGRGSVAGSLVAYVLRITDIDPLRHGLIFERFLNPERVSMPDIDIDFDDLRRGEVIEYVKRKYGEDNVTQIITFGTMGAKGVIRDVGRALGMTFADVDRIARMVPEGLGMTLARALELSPDLKALPERGPQLGRLLKTARVLEGLARHASTHAAGVLITPGPLLDYVPLCRQKDETVTTQWDMKSVEKAGLLKMDFLGLRTLSVLDDAVRLVEVHHGTTIDLPSLPMDDAPAYQVFQEAETVAIFQFESAGMRDQLKRLKPTVFGDLVAMNALYRPGPMENIPYFIDCKHGRQVARYDHPDLEPILKDTYGVFVYQEQVMQAANVLAGFSMAQADELRRAMGKKRPEEMEAKRQEFIEGCRHRKIAPAKAEKIFATMEKFAGYGFNKCVLSTTEVVDADTGEMMTVGWLFRSGARPRVHALDRTRKLRPRRILDVVWNGRKPVYELRTRLGKSIVATANHPLLALGGWQRLQDLRVDDRIATPRALPVSARHSWPRHEVIALAALISEANTCHPTTLYFHGKERTLVEDFAQGIARFPDTVARVSLRREGLMEVAANVGPPSLWRQGTAPVAEWISGNLALVREAPARRSGALRWAERRGILGKGATAKEIPPEVFQLCDMDLELFMGRLWSGDGFIANRTKFGPFYATSSPRLARGVQTLLLRLGIVSRIHARHFTYRGQRRVGYTVVLVGEGAAETFLRRAGPHIVGRDGQIDRLRRHLARTRRGLTSVDTVPVEDSADSDIFWDRIVSIEPRGIHDTYDLTVEHDHNFVANGLIVHNSHSAAYALLAYQCAYFKAHHRAEFMAATLTSEMSDSARIVTLIEECRRLGLGILPPDVNHSAWRFTIEGGDIRFGLGAVRNVGHAVVEGLVAARAGGAFSDLFDLACRLDARGMNKRVLESLVAAGACDALGGERGALFAAAGIMLERAASLRRERESGQSSLFGEAGEGAVAVVAPPLPEVPPWTGRERSAHEKEVLGFYFSEHPLEHVRERLESVATHRIAEALQLEDGAEVRVAGLVGEVKSLVTRSGRPMAMVTLEDLSGRMECTVFPDTFEGARALLTEETVVVASGRVEVREDRGTKLLLNEVRGLEEAQEAYRRCLHIEVRAEELSEKRLADIDDVLSSHPGPAEVYLHIVRPDHSRMAMRSRRFTVAEDDRVIAHLKQAHPALRVRWAKGAS